MHYYVIGAIALLIVIILIGLISTRNKFVVLRNRVKDQESQIEVQLKRRSDLISNLINTIKGQANFEKSTLEAVINARSKVMNSTGISETLNADKQLSGALSRLMAVAESYPELKTNNSFLSMQKELSETEDKIAYAIQFYNDVILKYNNAIQVFPANIVADMFGFKEIQYITINEKERENAVISADDFML